MLVQVIIVQVILFIGLVLGLRWILISSTYNETNRLQQLNTENTQKARDLDAKISDVESEYRDKMAKADIEVRQMREEAKKEANELKESIIAKSKLDGGRIIQQALSTKDEIRMEIEEQMAENSVTLSHKIFQQILGSEEQRLVHDGLLERVLQDLDKVSKDQLQSFDLEGISKKKIDVKTSFPMSPAQKEKLETILSSKLDQKISVQEIIEKEIIAGIVIVMGSFVIDGSLLERFRKATEELR